MSVVEDIQRAMWDASRDYKPLQAVRLTPEEYDSFRAELQPMMVAANPGGKDLFYGLPVVIHPLYAGIPLREREAMPDIEARGREVWEARK